MDTHRSVGGCRCTTWSLRVTLPQPSQALRPRVCDCDYCQAHPAGLLSAPDMAIELQGDRARLSIEQQGAQLASFYLCARCGDLLAVGCQLDGALRGACNGRLLRDWDAFGEPVPISPSSLSPNEKATRWAQLWGPLRIVPNR